MKKIIVLISFVFVFMSCRDDMNAGHVAQSDDIVSFDVRHEMMAGTKAASESGPVTGERHFLGMMDEDSIFVSVTEEIMPSYSSVSGQTKAAYTSTSLNSFRVTAFMDENTVYADDVLLSTSDGWNTYGPVLYWPKVFENLHFFAYSYNVGNDVVSPVLSMSGGGYSMTFDYALPASDGKGNDAQMQSDLIFAITPEQDGGTVELDFFHALSTVVFKIGDMADATVSKAVMTLGDIRHSGSCGLSHPVGLDGFDWHLDDGLADFTETSKGEFGKNTVINSDLETFNIHPQTLKGTDAYFEISLLIGEKTFEFPVKKLGLLTDEWKPGRRYIYTLSKSGYVEVDVEDNCTQTVKSDVKIQNTGLNTSYIRAAVVGYWAVIEDGTETIVASWDIDDATVGKLVKASDWDTCWEEKDGIYYCKTPVEPGEYTPVPLFERYDLLKTAGPVSGSKLNISIVVQAVEKSKAAEVWPGAPIL